MPRNHSMQYGSIARFFHWAIAILIVVTVPCSWVMYRIGAGVTQNVLYVVHESIGVTVSVLTALRLGWRLVDPPPPLPATVSRARARLAHLNHGLLYLSLFLMPVSGYLFVVAGGFPLTWLNLFDLPRIIGKNAGLSTDMETVHLSLQYVVYTLVGVHVLAAMDHYLIKQDEVLSRMWPHSDARNST